MSKPSQRVRWSRINTIYCSTHLFFWYEQKWPAHCLLTQPGNYNVCLWHKANYAQANVRYERGADFDGFKMNIDVVRIQCFP